VVREDLYLGLMSGTSLDGVDAVLADFADGKIRVLSHAHLPFPDAQRDALLALTQPGPDETGRAALQANALARLYAQTVGRCLEGKAPASAVRAIGCHGQTIRHQPALAYTVQIGNAALLAELTGIAVVSDFRSRDMAAGGQGAPLVPAFHAAAFADPQYARAVVNIGGIANLSLLVPGQPVRGFDTGPGNGLMDLWISRHLGQAYDAGGAWSLSGRPSGDLLAGFLADAYFARPAPKSTGRELFNLDWLLQHPVGALPPADVQASLRELTAESIARAIGQAGSPVDSIVVCGGGALNSALMQSLARRLAGRHVQSSAALGMDPSCVEAVAFAWLARQAVLGLPGNLPAVTGARGPRILGAIHPA
jgi:anhydro-N-acetylmuramic acid kinase